MNEFVLEVKNLNTSIISNKIETRIVKDVSFSLRRGTTLAIVGESGCGKSLMVSSIMKLLPNNTNSFAESINYFSNDDKTYDLSQMKPYGKEIRNLRGNHIGMVFQDPMTSLNPVCKVGIQVAESLIHHNDMKKKDALLEVLEMFKKIGIPDPKNRLNYYPFQFSGGMKQRVVIAIALINNPEIIIADEPTTALDVTTQAQIMELMKELQLKEKKSIILITHNMGLVAEMADEVCVMYMGRIVEFGNINQILNNPLHPYTTALLRSVPILGMDKNHKLETIKGSTPTPMELNTGCDFASRCNECTDICRINDIPIFEAESGHTVRCLKYNEYKKVE